MTFPHVSFTFSLLGNVIFVLVIFCISFLVLDFYTVGTAVVGNEITAHIFAFVYSTCFPRFISRETSVKLCLSFTSMTVIYFASLKDTHIDTRLHAFLFQLFIFCQQKPATQDYFPLVSICLSLTLWFSYSSATIIFLLLIYFVWLVLSEGKTFLESDTPFSLSHIWKSCCIDYACMYSFNSK